MFLAAARAALSQSARYSAMSNPYGIMLDREWAEWAAKIGVSSTVAAALLVISRSHPLPEVVARLTPGELEQVVGVIGRWPECFPPGTLAALKSVRLRLKRSPDPSAVSISTDQAPSWLAARTSAERLHRHRPHARKRVGRPFGHPGSATAAAMHISGMPNPYGIKLDDASIRWATAEGVSENSIGRRL